MGDRLKFTFAALDKLTCPPGKSRTYVYDTQRAGLCLSISASGSKIYYLYRKIAGRPERVRIGDFRSMSVDSARSAADGLNGDIAKGINPAEQRRNARGEMKFGDLFTRYMSEYAKPHKKSWADDQAMFDLYVVGWKNRTLSTIKQRNVRRRHTTIGAKKGKYAANRLLALVSGVFSFAESLGFEGTNPAKGVKRFKEQERERFLQPDEMPAFFKALDEHPDQNIADYFRLALFTGARRANVASMAWGDAHFGRRTWTIPHELMKNGQPMTVHLSEAALAVLSRRWAERVGSSPFVFPSHGKAGHLNDPKIAWAAILDRAGIKDMRLHDLRRSFGSWMAAGGASLLEIGKAMGHKSQQATKIYARLNLDPVRRVVDDATASMLNAGKPAKPAKNSKGRRLKSG